MTPSLNPEKKVRIHCARHQSPWQGYTSSAAEEEAGRTVQALASLTGFETLPHLEEWNQGPSAWLAIDRKNRRVVVSDRIFATVHRVDLARLKKGGNHTLTTLRDRSLAQDSISLSRFLILSELILTYAHLESSLELVANSRAPDGSAETEWKGSHEYYTHEHHVSPLHFRIRIHGQTGEISVENL